MATPQKDSLSSSSRPSLPPGFESIEQLQSMPNERLSTGPMVNVIGFVKDFQPPIKTNGPDYKCTLEIMDESIQYESRGLKIVIFWQLERMPKISGVSDVVLLRNFKAQFWSGRFSLLTNIASSFHFMHASKIPRALAAASSAPWMLAGEYKKYPSIIETKYVIWANSYIGEMALPTSQEFRDKSIVAMNVKEKFSLLQNIKPDTYCDILGEVIKVLDGASGMITLYLSDYTPNSHFYNNSWAESADAAAGREGDEYGYAKTRTKKVKDWPGPYGKLTIQLTLYDEHAAFVRENVKVKQWVLLRNVQIKFGRTGGCLEGFQRGDRNAFDGKVNVQIMEQVEDQSDEPSVNVLRWKDAIRRRHEWQKKFERQKKELLSESEGAGGKRKRENKESSQPNSKQRRHEKLAAAEAKIKMKLDLNENVKCYYPDNHTLPLEEILKPRSLPTKPGDTQKRISPFSVEKYRANVRVVDFFPHNIEDFAVGHKISDNDMLSDYSGGDDTDREEDMRQFRSGKGFPERRWEWRFALQVTDASPAPSNKYVWLIVNNEAAQLLLGVESNAANLRGNPQLLAEIREQLFKLWGDLEEQKSALQNSKSRKDKRQGKNIMPSPSPLEIASSPSSPSSQPPPRRRKAGDQPEINSDNETNTSKPPKSILAERDSNIISGGANIPGSAQKEGRSSKEQSQTEGKQTTTKPQVGFTVKNKGFPCCINQYGVRIPEEDPERADAGEGYRWERRFGLWGTKIV